MADYQGYGEATAVADALGAGADLKQGTGSAIAVADALGAGESYNYASGISCGVAVVTATGTKAARQGTGEITSVATLTAGYFYRRQGVEVALDGEASWTSKILVYAPSGGTLINRVPLLGNTYANPQAAVDVTGWDWSWVTLERVTSAPYPIPGPGTTAFHLIADDYGLGLESDDIGIPLPVGIGAGDWLHLQFAWLVASVTNAQAVADIVLWWMTGADSWSIEDEVNFVNQEYLSLPNNEMTEAALALITTPLPLIGWERFTAKVQVPDATPPITYVDFMVEVQRVYIDGTGVDVTGAELFITNIMLEKGSEFGEILPYTEGGFATEWTIETPTTHIGSTAQASWHVSGWLGRTSSTQWRINLAKATKDSFAEWSIVDSNYVGITTGGQWTNFSTVGPSMRGSWGIERRVEDVRTIVEMNGHNWNDGVYTFLKSGAKPPSLKPEFDEVRSYTGNIRQVDVHNKIVQATIPLMIKGIDSSDLQDRLQEIENDCLAGGILVWQDGTDEGQLADAVTYIVGVSSAPEVVRDSMFRKHNIAVFDVVLNIAPWW